MKYILPFLLFVLLALFFAGLPNLTDCRLPAEERSLRRSFTKKELITLLLLTMVYAAVAFYGLGNTTSPQSFKEVDARDEIHIDLGQEEDLYDLMVFTGITVGKYDIYYSTDNENWVLYTTYSQDYATLLKWQSILPDVGIPLPCRYLRIVGESGTPRIGELAVRDACGNYLSYTTDTPELNDEQELVPAESNYMNSSYFDEIYHARTAEENIEGIYPYEVSHPPLGKIIISLGIRLFGLTPFGWRFMGTLFGVLMLPLMYIFSKKLFGGFSVPFLCTVVFSFDFMHFVQTRIATIDTYAIFFIILMYFFMYQFLTTHTRECCEGTSEKSTLWLFLSGLFFGLGAASKWTCLYAGAGLAVLWAAHQILLIRKESFSEFLRISGLSVIFFILIPCLIYYISYYPYVVSQGLHGPSAFFSPNYLQTVLDNQKFMFSYHNHVTAEHPYSSRWYQWVFDIRPILYYLTYAEDGTRQSFGAFVSPSLCWGGLLALAVLVYMCIIRRDKTAAFLLVGYFAQLIPWMFITRVTFEYHYFACTIFLTLAIGYCADLIRREGRFPRIRIAGFCLLSIALFILFYPALSGIRVNNSTASSILQWLPTWPF